MSEPPGIGIHHGVPFEDYAAWDCVNSGAIKAGLRSMRAMRSFIDGERGKDTPDRRFGRAEHGRLLEPDLFDIRFGVATPCAAVKKDGETCGNAAKYLIDRNWLCGVHAPKGSTPETDFVSEPELARIDLMIDNLKGHKAVKLLRAHGGCEVSIVADVFGVRVKCRADKLIETVPTVVDVKKVGAGKIGPIREVKEFIPQTGTLIERPPRPPDEIEAAITNYGYHIQAALYKLAADAVTGRYHKFMWCFIEDGPPYDVCVAEMDSETFEIGRHEVRLVLENWKAAQEAGEFGGVYPGITRGGVKDWKRNQYKNWGLNREDGDDGERADEAGDGAGPLDGEFC